MRGFGRSVGQAALAAALLNAVSAPAAERVFATAEKPISADLYPGRATTFPGGVTGYPDVVYSVVPGYRPLVIDVYVPAGAAAKPKPLIVYTHGGGWVGGHTRHAGAIADFPKQLAALAAEGFLPQ